MCITEVLFLEYLRFNKKKLNSENVFECLNIQMNLIDKQL